MAEAIDGYRTRIVLCKPMFGSHITPNSGVIGDSIHENIIPYGGDKSISDDFMDMTGDISSTNPMSDDWHGMSDKVPISFAVTQFHIILVYTDCYLVINRLSKNCVAFEKVPCKINEKVQDIAIADNLYMLCLIHKYFKYEHKMNHVM